MIPELALPTSLHRHELDAAAAAMLHTGRRLSASANDIDLVCNTLFAEAIS